MQHFYFSDHKKTTSGKFPSLFFMETTRLKKHRYLFLMLVCFSTHLLFSQTDTNASFNASFWNGYADKLQLGPKERAEFMTSHEKFQAGTPQVIPQTTVQPQLPGGRTIGQPNATFAGPCVNADFELGNLTGWTRSCGFHPGYNPLGCCPNPNGQQTIMSGAANDPYGGFPLVFPGGNFSLRLGNNSTGGEADRIEQTFVVSSTNANFSYRYAVVFEDPNHPVNQQPFFQVEMVDTAGVAVPCTNYYVASGSGIPGFFNSSSAGVIYKPWSTVLVDLTPFIGQSITIRFSTYDCSLGGHFGYAYIDGVCQSFSSGGSATVCAGTSTTFCAPTGVDSYTWNGPGVTNFVGQCALTTAPGVYTVSTTLFTGCPGPMFTYTLLNQPQPIATAGPSSTVCANNNTVSLSGSITGFTSTPVWSSGGSGAFTSTTNLNTTYTPSAADIAAGSVTITLTTAGNGICPAATDKLTISITPSPVVNAGTGGSSCNSNAVALSGSVSAGATTGIWSTPGDGTFFPSASVLNASYTPGVADITAGGVTLTLTSTNYGNCFPASDTLIISIRQPVTADAGVNQSLCSTSPTLALSGIIGGGSSTGIWASSGTGTFAPANTNLNPRYTITPADIISGQVIFTLTSTNNGPCPAAVDTVKMVIIKPSTVTASSNQFLCSTAGSVALTGTVSGFSSTGNWTSNGSGAFNPASTSLSTNYSFTPADFTAGTVIFTLTSTNNGPCAAVKDTVMIRVRIPATVNAGTSQTLCSNAGSASLTGTIGGGSSTGSWSGSGTGAFVPSNTVLATAYQITAPDIASGLLNFTLTSTNNGPCAAVQNTVMVTVIHIATITAGPNQLICSNAGVIDLAGSINSPSNTVAWSSNGAGPFLPFNSVTTPTYNLTAADITAGAVIFTISSTNNGPCPVVSDSVKIAIKKLAVINSGANQTICSNIASVNLSGTIGGGATTVLWASSGAGGFLPGATGLNTAYGITAADVNSGTVTFTLASTNNGPCPAVLDTVMMAITKIATVTAGPNLYLCSNASTLNLAGTVNSPSSTAVWSGNGSGSFLPNTSAVNNTYSFSTADVAAGTVIFTLSSTNNGVCPVVRDTVKMRFLKIASVNAGTNQSVCSNTSTVFLNGAVNAGGTTGVWSSSGIGTFAPGTTSLNTSYAITPADISAGQVIFTLSSTNNGPCPVVTNTVSLAISKIATVTAGVNQYVCSSQNSIALNATITGVTSSGQWASSGLGSFVPGNTALNGSYSLTSNDVTNGMVIFTLTSSNNGVCPAISDTVKMRIMPLASVNAGTSQVLCSNISTLALNGSVTGASGTANWSTNGSGLFAPGNTVLSTTYSITPADINNGLVSFTLSSTSNGPCPVITNTVNLAISKIATVTAGPNQFVCSSQNSIALSGTVTGVTSSGQWASSGTGNFLPGNTVLANAYALTANDISNGAVIFTLTSTSNSVCPAVSDTVKMTIMKQATVNAGFNQALCSNISTLALNGTVNGASGTATWSANGAGIFVPGNASLTTAYSITPADITSGQVIFTLSSTGNGPCPIINDTVKITIRTIATVSAGVNQFICSAQNSIALNGAVSGATTTGQWASSGSGGFLPGNTALAGSYSLTALDVLNGAVTFTLASTNNGVCPVVRDTVKMRIMKMPVINAGPYQSICSLQNTVALAGIVNGGGNAGTWTSPNGGVFNNAISLNTFYTLSAQDISAGVVVFTLSSQNSTPCPEVTDTLGIRISTPAHVVAGSSQTICSNVSNVSLAGSSSGGTGTSLWSSTGTGSYTAGNTSLITDYALTAADISTGSVNFTLVSTNNGACLQSISNLNVLIQKLAHVSAGADKSICSTQLQVPLPGGISGVTTSGIWTGNGTGTFVPNIPVTTYSVSPADIIQGHLIMVLTSLSNGVCPVVTDTMKLTIESRPVIRVGADTSVCAKSTLVSLTSSVSGATAVQWSTSGTGVFLPSTAIIATHYSLSAADISAGNVSLMFGSSSSGPCAYTGATMLVHVLPGPHAAFSASAYTLHLPGDTIHFNNTSYSATSYTWAFGDGNNSTLTNPAHKYTNVGFYTTSLLAVSENGCTDVTDQLITVISDVQFATAFTPNLNSGNGGSYDINDYSNDVFFPYVQGVVDYDLMIFNRWGELIFRSTDVKIGWDGYFNGKLCQQDAYVYKVNMAFFDGRKYSKTGSVTLLR